MGTDYEPGHFQQLSQVGVYLGMLHRLSDNGKQTEGNLKCITLPQLLASATPSETRSIPEKELRD